MTNNVILEGRLGEAKVLEKVAYLSIGILRNFTCDHTGSPHKQIVWINNNLLTFSPEVMEQVQTFAKNPVRLEGFVSDKLYKDEEGKDVYQTQIVIHTLTPLSDS